MTSIVGLPGERVYRGDSVLYHMRILYRTRMVRSTYIPYAYGTIFRSAFIFSTCGGMMSSCSPGKAVLDIVCGSLSASLCVKDLYNGSSRCVLLGSVVLTPCESERR